MVPEVPDSAVDLARRVAELEAENRRLRQLLGFDGRPSVAPTWEPTLFTGQAEAAEQDTAAGPQSAAVTAGSTAPIATVERGRIASLGGIAGLIWLTILVLMIWQP